jgi:hypothetical protein
MAQERFVQSKHGLLTQVLLIIKKTPRVGDSREVHPCKYGIKKKEKHFYKKKNYFEYNDGHFRAGHFVGAGHFSCHFFNPDFECKLIQNMQKKKL